MSSFAAAKVFVGIALAAFVFEFTVGAASANTAFVVKVKTVETWAAVFGLMFALASFTWIRDRILRVVVLTVLSLLIIAWNVFFPVL
jgi:hypothetical protein